MTEVKGQRPQLRAAPRQRFNVWLWKLERSLLNPDACRMHHSNQLANWPDYSGEPLPVHALKESSTAEALSEIQGKMVVSFNYFDINPEFLPAGGLVDLNGQPKNTFVL